MRKQTQSRAGADRRDRIAGRTFRPRVELLEDRRLLAVDPLLFIEDFSLDSDHQQSGFDQADDIFSTPPDRLLIQHSLQARDTTFVSVESIDPSSTYQPSAPFAFGMLGPASDNIHLSPRGAPGGLASGEEVTSVAIAYSGLGTIRVFGDNGVKTINVSGPPTVWHSVTVTANSPSDTGQEVGAILSVTVSTFEVIYIDDVALLVNGIITNNPPVTIPDAVNTLPNTPVEFDPLANDGDTDGDDVILHRVTPPSRGTISFHDGQFIYTPDAGFHGSDTFDYFITDGRIPAGSEVLGTVRVTVNTPPPAPVVRIPVPHGHTGPFTFAAAAILSGVADADGDPLTIAALGPPLFGSLTQNGNGTFTYTPNPPAGLVSDDLLFEFRLSDGFTLGDLGVAQLDPNARPIASGQILEVEHGTPGPLHGTLHFTDPDGDPLDLTSLNTTPDPFTGFPRTARGTLLLNDGRSLEGLTGDVEFSYFPATGDLRGDDRFTFRVTDFYGTSNTANIEIRVPNCRPEVVLPPGGGNLTYVGGSTHLTPAGATTALGGIFSQSIVDGVALAELGGLSVGIDHDGDPLRPVLVDPPSHGTLEIYSAVPEGGNAQFPDYNFIYTPNPGAGFGEEDIFTYRLSDGVTESADLIYVRIERTPGEGIARSDSFFYHDDQGSLLDLFSGQIPFGEDGTHLESLSPAVRATLGLFEFKAHDLLSNDAFSFGLDAIRARQEIPGFDIHLQILSHLPLPGTGGYLRDEFNRNVGSGWSKDTFAFNDSIYFFPHNTSEPRTYEFEYRYVYQLPGLPPQFSNTAKAFIVAHKDDQSDADGLPNDVENAFGDTNGDGILDSQQAYVASMPHMTLVSGPGTPLMSVQPVPAANVGAALPDGVEFRLGFVKFQVTGLTAFEETAVTLIPPPGLYFDTYFKLNEVYAGENLVGYEAIEFLYGPASALGAEIINTDDADPDTDRIVLHLKDASFPSDQDRASNGVILDPGGPGSRLLPPTVEHVLVNDGHVQRSKINSLTVTFDQLLTIDANAFELRKKGVAKPVVLKVAVNEVAGQTVARLTFKNGRDVQFGSLANGTYRLTIRADKVRDASGRLLDGDANGQCGGNYVDEFFRLFGDTDGDGDVDSLDKQTFKSAYAKRANQPGYLWYLDHNANGRIWAEDAALFLLAYWRSNYRR